MVCGQILVLKEIHTIILTVKFIIRKNTTNLHRFQTYFFYVKQRIHYLDTCKDSSETKKRFILYSKDTI